MDTKTAPDVAKTIRFLELMSAKLKAAQHAVARFQKRLEVNPAEAFEMLGDDVLLAAAEVQVYTTVQKAISTEVSVRQFVQKRLNSGARLTGSAPGMPGLVAAQMTKVYAMVLEEMEYHDL